MLWFKVMHLHVTLKNGGHDIIDFNFQLECVKNKTKTHAPGKLTRHIGQSICEGDSTVYKGPAIHT